MKKHEKEILSIQSILANDLTDKSSFEKATDEMMLDITEIETK